MRLYVDEEGNRRSGFRLLGRSLVERFSDSLGGIVDSFDAHLEKHRMRAKLCDSRRLLQVFWLVARSALEQRENHKEVVELLLAGKNVRQTQYLQK